MRLLIILLLFGLSIPTRSQPVLTITDARPPVPVAPYAYFLEDFTHKLTYEQVSRFPMDSFHRVKLERAVHLGMRVGTIWLRFDLTNQTQDELILISTYWRYARKDLYIIDETGKLTIRQKGTDQPTVNQFTPTAHPIVSLGYHPKRVYITLYNNDFLNDYLKITDIDHGIIFQKQTSFWQGILLGVYLIVFLYAVVFYFRLRDPLIGWYALFIYINSHWFLDRSGYLLEFFGGDSFYARFRPYYPIHTILQLFLAIFLIKLINLREHSKLLYYTLACWISLDLIDFPISVITRFYGDYYSPLRSLASFIGIEYVGYAAITFLILIISLIYVSLINFKVVRWYALAFSVGLITMIIAILALFDTSGVHYYPYNNIYFIGSLVEIAILGFSLADRTNQHRRAQNQTQQQLIDQLQENLRQKNKLLQIRDEIARDLHDEVGATLTSIAISTKLVQKKFGPERTEVTPILEQIQSDSQDTIHTIRDTVWALNPDNDAPEKLIERMRAVGFQIFTNQDIHLSFENEVVADTMPPFSMEQRRNIYFVYKEALHNIVKHAQATDAEVTISQPGGELSIRISDNGTGFETDRTGDGNGLKNFRKRATEGGFSVKVYSKKGRGTIVELQIPVRVHQSFV